MLGANVHAANISATFFLSGKKQMFHRHSGGVYADRLTVFVKPVIPSTSTHASVSEA